MLSSSALPCALLLCPGPASSRILEPPQPCSWCWLGGRRQPHSTPLFKSAPRNLLVEGV